MRFLALFFCFFAATVVTAGNLTVATVDMQKIFKTYPGTVLAQKKFDKFAESKKQELVDAQKILKDMQVEFTDLKGKLSLKMKKEKEDEFQQASQDYEKQKNDIQTELTDRQTEMTETLLDQIKIVIAKVAREKDVDLVLDSNDVAGLKRDLDLTDDVLKRFSKIKMDSLKPDNS